MPIFLGGFIYVLFRAETIRFFKWIDVFKIDLYIQSCREAVTGLKEIAPNWFIYSLPDGIWVYSLSSALLLLWDGKLTGWLFIPFLGGVMLEFFQAWNLLTGTFDIVDVFFTISALILSISIFTTKNQFHGNTN